MKTTEEVVSILNELKGDVTEITNACGFRQLIDMKISELQNHEK